MTRPGASSAKTKKKEEQVVVKRRGAKCHFVGEQWDFLAGGAPQFRIAVDNGTQGLFYKMMGRRFIRKWGWNNVQVPAGEDDDEADDDPNAAADNAKIAAADNANIVEDNSIDPALRGTTSEAVANESSEEFNAFARVSIPLLLYRPPLIYPCRNWASSTATISEGPRYPRRLR